MLAGVASLIVFSLGAVLPLLPYLLGLPSLITPLLIPAVALVTGGMVVGRSPADRCCAPVPASSLSARSLWQSPSRSDTL